MKINHLSVSRSQVWVECEQKYKFRYHLEIPSLEEEQPYFIYGKVIHKIIEEYTENRGKKELKGIVQAVLNGELEVEPGAGKPVIPPDYLQRLPREMAAFAKLTKQIGLEGETEFKFNYDLDPPNEKYLYGFIDRLIINDDRAFVIDYKTTRKSRWRKDLRTITDDLQLRAYAMVVSDHFNIDPKKIRVALYFLDGAELVGASFTRETLIKTRAELLSAFNAIKNSVPENVVGNVGSHCKRCDYRKVCPFFKG